MTRIEPTGAERAASWLTAIGPLLLLAGIIGSFAFSVTALVIVPQRQLGATLTDRIESICVIGWFVADSALVLASRHDEQVMFHQTVSRG